MNKNDAKPCPIRWILLLQEIDMKVKNRMEQKKQSNRPSIKQSNTPTSSHYMKEHVKIKMNINLISSVIIGF